MLSSRVSNRESKPRSDICQNLNALVRRWIKLCNLFPWLNAKPQSQGHQMKFVDPSKMSWIVAMWVKICLFGKYRFLALKMHYYALQGCTFSVLAVFQTSLPSTTFVIFLFTSFNVADSPDADAVFCSRSVSSTLPPLKLLRLLATCLIECSCLEDLQAGYIPSSPSTSFLFTKLAALCPCWQVSPHYKGLGSHYAEDVGRPTSPWSCTTVCHTWV